jgi:DNA-binding XRE family transcriptional regulator
MPTAGPTLRRERRIADITTVALAKEMGISRATLYTLERAAVVSPEQVAAHRAAVKTLRDGKTEDAA